MINCSFLAFAVAVSRLFSCYEYFVYAVGLYAHSGCEAAWRCTSRHSRGMDPSDCDIRIFIPKLSSRGVMRALNAGLGWANQGPACTIPLAPIDGSSWCAVACPWCALDIVVRKATLRRVDALAAPLGLGSFPVAPPVAQWVEAPSEFQQPATTPAAPRASPPVFSPASRKGPLHRCAGSLYPALYRFQPPTTRKPGLYNATTSGPVARAGRETRPLHPSIHPSFSQQHCLLRLALVQSCTN
ncbi:hypothetical protein EDB80DRAFT_399235 [Ilyonectria destructans]|nr:hypothetical protein EDB80DRAFT_399235 [Ilyonectria destructans]